MFVYVLNVLFVPFAVALWDGELRIKHFTTLRHMFVSNKER